MFLEHQQRTSATHEFYKPQQEAVFQPFIRDHKILCMIQNYELEVVWRNLWRNYSAVIIHWGKKRKKTQQNPKTPHIFHVIYINEKIKASQRYLTCKKKKNPPKKPNTVASNWNNKLHFTEKSAWISQLKSQGKEKI